MTFLEWATSNRTVITEALSRSVVVLPIGAIEQHGPHLPTNTDFSVVSYLAQAASRAAGRQAGTDVVLAPGMPFGISGHHVRFGGTLTLSAATMAAVLTELVHSIHQQGGRKILLVNGHGGNRGVCRTVAMIADSISELTVATTEYWDCVPGLEPGHAGAVETSLITAIQPDLITYPLPDRENIPLPKLPSGSYHGAWIWDQIDGFTDVPAQARQLNGSAMLAEVTAGLVDVITQFANLDRRML